jgi:8-oxo-dGTP pyrophosphatase MutT (NUDIX family)
MAHRPSPRTPGRSPTGHPTLDAIQAELASLDTELEERVTGHRQIYRGRYMLVERNEVVRPDGAQAQRDIVVHPGAVVVAALDSEQRLLLVAQYRLAAGGALLELPAGTLDVHDGVVEDPATAALRELEEETGYRAGQMRKLAGYYSAPGFLTEYLTLFLATDLVPAGPDRLAPDEDERLRLFRLHWRDAITAVETGLIEDAKSVAAILLLARRLERSAS